MSRRGDGPGHNVATGRAVAATKLTIPGRVALAWPGPSCRRASTTTTGSPSCRPPPGGCEPHAARGSRFTGRISWVQLDVGTDDHDHVIDPDERLRTAMARQ